MVVDANHHVTKFTISDGSDGVDQIHNVIETSSRYLQTGGTYKDGPLLVEYFVGDAGAAIVVHPARRGNQGTHRQARHLRQQLESERRLYGASAGRRLRYGRLCAGHLCAAIDRAQLLYRLHQYRRLARRRRRAMQIRLQPEHRARHGAVRRWTQIDVEKVFQLAGIPNVNFDCLKECTGSDGKKYAQPVGTFSERVRSGYLMTDYNIDHLPWTDRALPFGWEVDGNVGVRIVNTKVEGTGIMSFTSIQKTAAYNPSNPNQAGGTVTNTLSTPTVMSASTTDYRPSFNAALSKTAFTFLPWALKYTGFDANYTKLRSATSAVNVVDLITGTPLPPARESKYSYNLALWYDDGALSARVAVQAVASYFTCIAACGATSVNNHPSSPGVTRITVTPYNPGPPNFRDGTRYIDAKIAYRFKNGIEIFAEGGNLGRATTSNSQGSFSPFADGTPNLLDYAYAGRRIMIGMNIRSL